MRFVLLHHWGDDVTSHFLMIANARVPLPLNRPPPELGTGMAFS